jgi:hypothetical protein
MKTETPDSPVTTNPEEKSIEIAPGLNPALPLYIVWFRRGNRAPEVKSFQFHGNLSQAIVKSRNYCEQMGYRFCGTYPFLTDLDKEMEAKQRGEFFS